MTQQPALYSFLNKYAGFFLFFFFSILGVITFREYGISWDEDYQREIGMVSWNYIFSNDQTLLSYPMRDYGVAFELPLIALEKLFNFEDLKDVYLMRHLVSHLFFLIGALFCFKLIDLVYNTKLLALAGFLIFVLHPTIYGHSFFNTKDVPFLSMLTICFYLATKAILNKKFFNFLMLSIGIGLLINIRLMGTLLLLCVLILLMKDAITEKRIWQNVKWMLMLVLISLIVLFISWPYLWADPISNYLTAFSNMSQFRWPHANLFKGVLIPATEIPWDYIPTWFSITTPIPYLFLGASGIVLLFIALLNNTRAFLNDPIKKIHLIFLIFFIVPVLAVIFLHSVLYDGWRHLYFIYPAFVMLCIYALHILTKQTKAILIVFMVLSFMSVAGFMIMNFPVQHVYFNYFVSRHSEPEYIRKNYELDYWGSSFKQAVDYILVKDSSKTINVYVEQFPSSNLYILMSPENRERLHFVSKEMATYFVTNYRWHPEDYAFTQAPFYSLRVLNSSVIDVYKLK